MTMEEKAISKSKLALFWGKVKALVNSAVQNLYTKPSGGIPKSDLSDEIKTSLGKADTALQSFTESDPTVPAWAKQPSKPSYTPSEVGALPDTTKYAGSQSVGGAANKAVSIPFGQVDSTSTANAFTATVDGITELRDGVCCWIRNNVVGSTTNCTLDINGLGAKPMYSSISDASRITTHFEKRYTILFIYNSTRVEGGCWDFVVGYDSNTDQFGPKIDQNKADIEALQEEAVEVGARAGSYDHIPLLGGQPMILFGSGAPVEANIPDNWIGFNDGGFEWIGTPSMMGQQYIDTTNGEKYVSIKNDFTLSWLRV